MPRFIKEAPWYMGANDENTSQELFHQRMAKSKNEGNGLNTWYKKGFSASAATKYRKGACTNCGAMTHSSKECVERPRKLGAKYSNSNIARDEFDTSKQNIKLGFEAKRDRWNGYDQDEYKKIIEQYNQAESEKKAKGGDANSDSSSDEDADKDAIKAPTHNLRIREDTAKYLRNLNPNSAPYDPKSRSMKENPNPAKL